MTKMTRITGVLGTAAAGLMLLSTPALADGGDPEADELQVHYVRVDSNNNNIQFCGDKVESERPTVATDAVSNPDGGNCVNHQHAVSNHAFDVD
ncbi:hypothetical protein ACWEWI_02820 [Streptomyces sp. NPDC003753]